MLRLLRKINLVLLILVALQGVALWRTQSANAITAFLWEPFYGNWQESTKKYDSYPIARNSSFDHDLPDYNNPERNQTFTFRDGSVVNVVPGTKCGSGGGERNCYNGHPGIDYNLFYAPAVAAAAGEVIYAGWDNPNHDGFNLGLLVRIDHWNNYRTEYGHLSAVVAYTGRIIGAYDPYKKSHEQIGTSGNTGNSTGPHLHFEVQNLHNNVWKVVDPFGWSGGSGRDPWENNGGAPSVNLWVTAPRQYPPPGDGPIVIDDGNSGFTSSSGWNVVSTGGYNNDLRWKLSSVSQTAWVKWKPTVPIRTTYEIQAYIPAYPVNNELARTHAASYEIYNNGQRIRTVTVDQHRVGIRFDENGNISGRNSQWVSLGRYEFYAGSNSYVRLTNAAQFVCNNSDIQGCTLYSESGKYIVVDAMRFYAN